LRQALIAERNHDLERAIGLLERAVDQSPGDPSTRAWLGWLYADREQYAAAIDVLQVAISLDSNHSRSHAVLAEVLLALERFAEAEVAAIRSLESGPKSSTYVVLGAAQSAQGNKAEATTSFRRAIELDTGNEEAMYNLALEVRSTDPAESARLLESAIRIDPRYWDAYREYGFHFALSNQTARAEEMLRQAIAGNPSDSKAHVYLASALASLGQLREAEETFVRARELSPVEALPHWTLANLYEAQGRHSEAEASYRAAAELDPRDSEAAFQLARFLISGGKQREGSVWVARALELNPQHKRAMRLKQRQDSQER
jgi:tetratricopeptide (TPR) repeat protein